MSLEIDLQHEQVIHLDISNFIQVDSGTSVKDTVEQMRTTDHNCAIITKDNALIGIFTDRDLLRKVVDAPDTWDAPIDNVMTTSPITVAANRPAYEALDLMDKEHFRNVPVVASSGKVIGNLTHHAIIKYLAGRFPESVYNLPPQPNQVSEKRGGA
mgnify:CR=1 FL=1